MRGVTAIAGCFFLAGGPAAANPFADLTGRQLYERFCASCHGDAGFGDGPVAGSLKVTIPDLTRLYRANGNKFPEERVRRIIDGRQVLPAHGTRYMPVWGVEFPVAQDTGPGAGAEAGKMIDKLVEYLHSIQQ